MRNEAESFTSVKQRACLRKPGISVPGELGTGDAAEGLLSGVVRSVLEIARRRRWSRIDLYGSIGQYFVRCVFASSARNQSVREL